MRSCREYHDLRIVCYVLLDDHRVLFAYPHWWGCEKPQAVGTGSSGANSIVSGGENWESNAICGTDGWN